MLRVVLAVVVVASATNAAKAEVRYAITEICRDTSVFPEQPYAINSFGAVVGTYLGAAGQHAFLYSGGTFTDLGTANHSSFANDINDAGQVVMNVAVAGGDLHAVLYSNGTFTDLTELTTGDANGRIRRANGINNLGHVTGIGEIGAIVYDGSSVTNLGTLAGGISV